jgi:predicted Zn-dependent peptidase
MQSEKGNITNELTGYKNNYGRLIWTYMQKDMGEDILLLDEELRTLPNITLKDVQDFHGYTHTMENMRFIIAGNLKGRKSKIREMIEGFGLAKGERLVVPSDEYSSAPARLIQRKDASNLSFGWTMVLDRHIDPDEELSMDALNHILTGTLYSRILGRARRGGLVYGVFSESSTREDASAWDFGGEVNYESAKELLEVMAEEIKKVADGDVKDSEIEACKSYALGRYAMSGQTVGALAGMHAQDYINMDEVNLLSERPEKIKRLNKADVVRMANEFIRNKKWTLTMVGNKDFVNVKELSSILERIFE